jgi:hypothetical protein
VTFCCKCPNRVTILHNSDFLKVFPSEFLENLCDILSRSIEPSLLWSKIFVFMSLISILASSDLYGECLIMETTLASEFGFAASKSMMGGCSLELEVAFFFILQSLELLHDCQYSSRFLNNLCATCPSMKLSHRVMEVALSTTSRLKNVHLCVKHMFHILKCQHDHQYANAVVCRFSLSNRAYSYHATHKLILTLQVKFETATVEMAIIFSCNT